MKYKRYLMTFVEVMIILTIILLSVGLIGVNIKRLIVQQRFKSEVSLVVDQLRLAQDIMLMLNADVLVKFISNDQGFALKIEVENILSPGWQREIQRERPLLTSIRTIEFDNQASGVKTNAPFDVKFLSGGSTMSQGILRLASSENDLKTYIFFPGYAYPIESRENNEDNITASFSKSSRFF